MNHNKQTTKHIIIGFKLFVSEMVILIKSPVFLLLTILGNLLIGFFSLLFYFVETPQNSKIHGLMDAIWWGFSTATTTGYGDITPVTLKGKILGILLMLTGTAIFSMFTALFAETILTSTRQNRS